ncbi:hypothetical protein EHQ81_03980 [Leptospira selangorensis]|uniref:Uncharacterized protein n=1 Tax=Leptospira selangorensis TaxID=2484982 RepID=A0A5F2C1R6_9LEPT|nr:hypothetical protein [Leptospira selangorensis]TGM15562.1 hypothetical protein EHQ81_03980 [Leptospira selangorensis]TGM18488.1 hypothetical protein EHQ82_15725 [Leptospira selangorensis]
MRSFIEKSILISLVLLFLLNCGERDNQRGSRDECKDQSATLNYFYGICLEDPPTGGCDTALARALYQAHLCSGMKVIAPF